MGQQQEGRQPAASAVPAKKAPGGEQAADPPAGQQPAEIQQEGEDAHHIRDVKIREKQHRQGGGESADAPLVKNAAGRQRHQWQQHHPVQPHQVEAIGYPVARQPVQGGEQQVDPAANAVALAQPEGKGQGRGGQLHGNDEQYGLGQHGPGKAEQQQGEGTGQIIRQQAQKIHAQAGVPGEQQAAAGFHHVVQRRMKLHILLVQIRDEYRFAAEGVEAEHRQRRCPYDRGQTKGGQHPPPSSVPPRRRAGRVGSGGSSVYDRSC